MSELKGQLDEFVGEAHEPADYDRDTGEVLEAKPQRRTRSDKGKPHSRHARAHETGLPIPGEEKISINLRHWTALGRTDPAHTKPFRRAGGFQGTAIKPIWTERLMTEHFGPCGSGWGMGKPEFQLVPVEKSGELMVYCTVRLWYVETKADPGNEVWGVGGDKVITLRRDGLHSNDEAFKSAYTDALSNAMKHIGVAADVHMGLFDDNKYVREVTEAFAQPATPSNGQNQISAEAPLTRDEWLQVGKQEAIKGSANLEIWWRKKDGLSKDVRDMLTPDLARLKKLAAKADEVLNP